MTTQIESGIAAALFAAFVGWSIFKGRISFRGGGSIERDKMPTVFWALNIMFSVVALGLLLTALQPPTLTPN